MLTILIVVLLVLLLMGGVPAYRYRGDIGPWPGGLIGLLIVVLIVVLLVRML